MNRYSAALLPALFILAAGWLSTAHEAGDGQTKSAGKGDDPAPRIGLRKRIPWTASRIKGSPEPPPPYRAQRVFAKLSFHQPLLITYVPGKKRLLVAEQAGRIYTFRHKRDAAEKNLFIDLPKAIKSYDKKKVRGIGAVYGLAFHPKFASNRYCFICYTLLAKNRGHHLSAGTRVSRFRVSNTDPPRAIPASEKIILTFLEGGHNGGCLKFGHDGFLYISTGDATPPNPPDELDTGQDCSDLLSSILRIDVDRTEKGKNYATPWDNPFVNRKGIRPEIWAYGFRNPWRMSFDRKTGDLWVGDVGWEMWELVQRVEKGGNYGWSVMEGRQPVKPTGRRGPTPIRPPTLAFPHTQAASITGGFVYRGKRYPTLRGLYICGDWETKTIWGAWWDGKKIASIKTLAQTTQRIVAFGEDEAGEIYYLDHVPKGGVYQLVPNDRAKDLSKSFPRRLSATGLFANTAELEPAAGVLPFSINAERWLDHATAQRWVAIPGAGTAIMYPHKQAISRSMFRGKFFFPTNSVLAKTLSLEMERGKPASRKKIETQILHFDGVFWRAYSYRWNAEQTDALLVKAAGAERILKIKDRQAPGGRRTHKWRFMGRGQCLQCHNNWAGFNLAFRPSQLDRRCQYGANMGDQLATLEHIGLVQHSVSKAKEKQRPKQYWRPLANPYNAALDIAKRARSYLHANCAHCHQNGAGGTATMDVRFEHSLQQTKTVDRVPVQGTFEIENAKIVAPGNPYQSVLYFRMATVGRGRMPHIGSQFVDRRGLRLIHDWIKQLPPYAKENEVIANLQRWNEKRRHKSITELLQSTATALVLLRALEQNRLPKAVRRQVIELAVNQPKSHVRDLFERFLPDNRRIKRLGDAINPKVILAHNGDARRGRKLFFASTSACLKCHRLGERGVVVGPELTKIGSKMKRAEILENILEPSKKMEPKYRAHVVITKKGLVLTGMLEMKDKKETVLRDPIRNTSQRVPADQIEKHFQSPHSLMPAGLLRDLTAQQAADLLAFLESLR